MSGVQPPRGLRTVALAKQVARGDFTAQLGADGRLIRPEDHLETNPFCRRAITHAVQVARESSGQSRVITMGPPISIEVGQEALACGVDEAVLVSDPELAGSDCLITARALAAAIRATGDFDVVFTGHSAVDSNTAVVGAMVAEILDVPFVGPVREFAVIADTGRNTYASVEVQADGRREVMQVSLPAVISVTERSTYPSKAPREAWHGVGSVTRLPLEALGAGPWGLGASPTQVIGTRPDVSERAGEVLPDISTASINRVVTALERRGVFTREASVSESRVQALPPLERRGERDLIVLIGDADDRAARALLGEAAVTAELVDARLIAVGAAARAPRFAKWGADALWEPDLTDPRGVAQALSAACVDPPWAVIGPSTAWAREVLARLAVRLNCGLISDVSQLAVSADLSLIGSKPSGDDTVAAISVSGMTRLASVHTGSLAQRAAHDAVPPIPVRRLLVPVVAGIRHLSRALEDDYALLEEADVVIGIGRGVEPSRISELDDLRRLLSAEFAATRPVTDVGTLPHSRQVGITARSIAPRVYLAVGISGDLNHVAGIRRSGLVVAINSDPNASIFRHADLGLVGDWSTIVRDLVDRIQHAGLALSTMPAGRAGECQPSGLLESPSGVGEFEDVRQ